MGRSLAIYGVSEIDGALAEKFDNMSESDGAIEYGGLGNWQTAAVKEDSAEDWERDLGRSYPVRVQKNSLFDICEAEFGTTGAVSIRYQPGSGDRRNDVFACVDGDGNAIGFLTDELIEKHKVTADEEMLLYRREYLGSLPVYRLDLPPDADRLDTPVLADRIVNAVLDSEDADDITYIGSEELALMLKTMALIHRGERVVALPD